MAARGTASKEQIISALQSLFPSAFTAGKEFRIPLVEDGEEVQIKVSLTAAKENISHDTPVTLTPATPTSAPLVTQAEKAAVEDFMNNPFNF